MPQSKERKKEYDAWYNAKPEQKKKRAMRNAARRKMVEAGKVKPGQDVDHKKMLRDGGSNDMSNLRAVSQKENRGWKRGKSGLRGR